MGATLHDPDGLVDIRELVAEVVDQPDAWLDHPHPLLGGMAPRELIGTDREGILRNLVESIKIGMFT